MSHNNESENNHDEIENCFTVSKPKKGPKNRHEDEEEKIYRNKFTINSFTYKIIETDMVVLGCISAIKTLSLYVELPCCTNGVILIKSISDEFTNNLNKALDTEDELNLLTNVFEVGQLLPVKVMEKNQMDNGTRLILSTKPSDINLNRTYKAFEENSLIWASVVEKEDQHYVLSAGVQNCRIVLPLANVMSDVSYVVGEPLYCVVKKCEIASQKTTLQVSTLQKDMNNQLSTSINLNYLLPGSKVNFRIDHISEAGLQGKVSDSYLSCVPQIFFARPFSNATQYKEDQVIKAQVMYSEPITNFIYLALSTETVTPHKKVGEIVNCFVQTKASNGLIIKFQNSNSRGLITYNRLLKSIETPKVDLSNLLITKYKPSTMHRCRIIDYNHMHNLYICAIDAEVLKEKYFTFEDINVGQTVNGKIRKVIDTGIVMRIGNLLGFVPNLHIADVQYTDNIKNKYRVNQYVNLKVFQIKNKTLLLTMKQTLLDSDNCLCNLEEFDKNKRYPGVVIHKSMKEVTLLFYNGIVGYLKRREITDNDSDDIEKMYYLGQVLLVYVNAVKQNRVWLSLEYKETFTTRKLLLGQVVNGRVINCIDNHTLVLDITEYGTSAELPLAHLSENIEYGRYLLEKYKIGDQICDLMCVSNHDDKIVVSLRETKHFLDKKIPTLNTLKTGQIIRCSYSHMDENGFIFNSPIIPSTTKVIVPIMELIDNSSDIAHIKFIPHQLVMVQVMGVTTQQVTGTAKLSQISTMKYDEALDQLTNYFEDVEKCKEHLSESDDPILNFYEGDIVDGTVQYVNSNGDCIITLENGVKGILNWIHARKSNKEGDLVTCRVLYVDFIRGCVDLSTKKNYTSKLGNGKTDLAVNCDTTYLATMLLVKDYFVQCLVKKDKVNKLVYLPVKMHTNDFLHNTEHFKQKINEKLKLFVLREFEGKMLGISKYQMNTIETKERNISEIKYKMQHLMQSLLPKENKSPKKRKGRTCVRMNNFETDDDDFANFVENELYLDETMLHDNYPMSDTEEMVATSTDELEIVGNNDEPEENAEEVNRSKCRYVTKNLARDQEHESTGARRNSDEQSTIQEVEEQITDEGNDDNELTQSGNVVEQIQEPDMDSIRNGEDSNVGRYVKKRSNDDLIEDNQKKKIKIAKNDEQENNCNTSTGPVLSGVSQFFMNTSLNGINEESSAGEDEETIRKFEITKKKRRLTSKERADLIRKEEEKLREVEIRLADSTEMPTSAEEFDRLLLANPNDSLLWTKYISYYVESTEIDKARSIVRRAIEKIKSTNEQDRFNIWVTSLNLESTFGTQESFDKVFEEAARCNDDYKIFMTAIEILGDAQKFTEMNKKMKRCRAKFKENEKMWIELGLKLYKYKRIDEARQLQNFAITSLQHKTKHLEVLVQFAKNEFEYGEKTHAEALFETILSSYPQRIDVWVKYTDQLVKKRDYELARKVFARAVGQKLGVKKMKVIYKAYLAFEMEHGTESDVTRVKGLARDYLKDYVNV